MPGQRYRMLKKVASLEAGTIVVRVKAKRGNRQWAVVAEGHHIAGSPEEYPAVGVYEVELELANVQ